MKHKEITTEQKERIKELFHNPSHPEAEFEFTTREDCYTITITSDGDYARLRKGTLIDSGIIQIAGILLCNNGSHLVREWEEPYEISRDKYGQGVMGTITKFEIFLKFWAG